ncbi:MAG: hypothetical protein HEEMFOPI_00157 [Holosporales bacterium]
MKIYNQILSNLTDNGQHCAQDLVIFNLEVKAAEGELVFAEIIAKKQAVPHPFIVLTLNDTPFFKGELFGPIQYIEPDQMKIFYKAKSSPLKEASYPSYFKDVLYQDFTLPFVTPLTHEQGVYSPFLEKNENVLDLTPFVLEKTLKLEEIRQKQKEIVLKIEALWEQKNTHIINLWPLILQKINGTHLKTLTPNAIKAMFLKIGQTLSTNGIKKTGYRVLFSKIKECKEKDAFLVPLKNKKEAVIPVLSFKGELVIEAYHSFKRKEVFLSKITLESDDEVSFLIQNEEDLKTKHPPNNVTLTIDESFLKEDEGTFLITPEGKKAICQGLLLSLYKLLFSNFNILLNFKIPFQKGFNLDLGKSVSIQYEGKTVVGKIARYLSKINDKESTTHLWITIIPKNIDANIIEKTKEHINHFVERITPVDKNIAFDDPLSLTINDFIHALNIFNQAEDQARLLQNEMFESIEQIKSFLHQIPTFFEIDLLDLKNKDPIYQTYKII